MRPFLTLFALLSLTVAFGQSAPLAFTEVVPADSIPKAELYSRARQWFAATFRDAGKVLQVQDKDAGELMGKGARPYQSKIFISSSSTPGVIRYTVKVFVKEGRYKYEITDFTHEAYTTNPSPFSVGLITTVELYPYSMKGNPKKWYANVWVEMKGHAEAEAQLLITSLKKAMATSTQAAAGQDW